MPRKSDASPGSKEPAKACTICKSVRSQRGTIAGKWICTNRQICNRRASSDTIKNDGIDKKDAKLAKTRMCADCFEHTDDFENVEGRLYHIDRRVCKRVKAKWKPYERKGSAN